MRRLLRYEPNVRPSTPEELLAVAAALEEEAVRRYGQLADLMQRRGMPGTAVTFRALAEEERDHVDGIAAWARSAVRSPLDPRDFTWALPREMAESWEELTDRTRVAPYEALSVAVLNEMRAFAFYSYIAAATTDERLRQAAERLADEELGHAALLRRERRRAFHVGRRAGRTEPSPTDAAGFRLRLAALASEAEARHEAIAAALDAVDDAESAAMIRCIAAEERALAGAVVPPSELEPVAGSSATLLRAALAPGERLSEAMGDIAAHATDDAILQEAQRVQEIAVRHLARLAARLAAVERRTP